MNDLSGRTAVVTGAASGIGLELADRFGQAGMRVVLADVETTALEQATTALRGKGHTVAAQETDVRELEQIQALEAFATETFGNVHVLCNNAGVGTGGQVAGIENLELWKWTIDIDLWGVIYGCKVSLPGMMAHGEEARIVNTASMAGHGSAPLMGAYNVSKYGVVALSETMAREMLIAQSTVGVSVLCPAFVATSIAQSDRNLPDGVQRPQRETPLESRTQTAIEAMVAGGISTEIVGQAVIDAIANDEFWILTHPEVKPGVLQRARQIVEGVNPDLNLRLG